MKTKEEVILSIIIVNYNTLELTKNCINSIIDNTSIPYEIIIIDNNSHEKGVETLSQKSKNISIVHSKKNLGFGKANNIGMQMAKGKYFLLLNSDTIVLERALDKCLHFFEQLHDKEIGVLGCKLLNPDHSFQNSFWTTDNKSNLLDVWIKGLKKSFLINKVSNLFTSSHHKNNHAINTPRIIKGLYGAFILLKKEVFIETGGFDTDFFMYCEETEWFRNRIEGKFKTFYYPEAEVIHIGGGSSSITKGVSWAMMQHTLSYFLYWYKLSKIKFWLFTVSSSIGNLMNLPILMFSKYHYRNQFHVHFKLLTTVLFKIPKYSNKFNSRKEPLKINI